MIFGNFGSSSGPPAFTRPSAAEPNFMPRSLQTGFIPEFAPYPTIMNPRMARVPKNIALPAASEPGMPAPAPATAVPAQAPNGLPSPVKVRAKRLLPPYLVMAMGIMPVGRGLHSNLNPNALVSAGRKPGV